MKVRLTIDLELPDEFEDYSEEELAQELFDVYTHYVVCKHSEEAMHWCAKGKIGSDNEDLLDKRIYEYHDAAATYTRATEWKFERLPLKQQPAEAAPGAVAYRFRHSAQENWHYDDCPKSWWECQPLYATPNPQPVDDTYLLREMRLAVELSNSAGSQDIATAYVVRWIAALEAAHLRPQPVDDAMVNKALHARVPGGAEVWHWLPQDELGAPHATAYCVMHAALEAASHAAPVVADATFQRALAAYQQARWRGRPEDMDMDTAFKHGEGIRAALEAAGRRA